jgi:hypothetical protein
MSTQPRQARQSGQVVLQSQGARAQERLAYGEGRWNPGSDQERTRGCRTGETALTRTARFHTQRGGILGERLNRPPTNRAGTGRDAFAPNALSAIQKAGPPTTLRG